MEEDKSLVEATATIEVSTIPTTPINGKKTPIEGKKQAKKRGAFTLIKAAMFMVGRGPRGKSKPRVQMEVASNDKLMKLVGSMRPLHLQDNQSPPPSIGQQFEGVISTLSSPDRPSSPSSSVHSMSRYGSAPNLQALDKGDVSPYASSTNLQELAEVDKGSEYSSESRYASSTDLQKLDKRSNRFASAKDLLELDLKGESGDDDSDEELDNNGGDEKIDAKADEFISKFYNQMKIQHKHSF